jgi:hypothetical protein
MLGQMPDYTTGLWDPEGTYTPPIAGDGDGFSWSEILANFGYYPPALGAVAAAVARPTLANIRAVENAYARGGYSAPGPLIDWLYSRYYETLPQRLPGEVTGAVAQYWPLFLLGGLLLFTRRK